MFDRFKCNISDASVRLDGNDQPRRDLPVARRVERSSGNIPRPQPDKQDFSPSMKQRKPRAKLFAVCIDNRGYPASLELHKIYRVIPDDAAAADGDVRVVDESGEDYLYSADRFVEIEPPQTVKRSLLHPAKAA